MLLTESRLCLDRGKSTALGERVLLALSRDDFGRLG